MGMEGVVYVGSGYAWAFRAVHVGTDAAGDVVAAEDPAAHDVVQLVFAVDVHQGRLAHVGHAGTAEDGTLHVAALQCHCRLACEVA